MSQGDWLKVYDVNGSKLFTDDILLGTFGVDNVPHVLTSATNEINVRFRSFPDSQGGHIRFTFQTGMTQRIVQLVS